MSFELNPSHPSDLNWNPRGDVRPMIKVEEIIIESWIVSKRAVNSETFSWKA